MNSTAEPEKTEAPKILPSEIQKWNTTRFLFYTKNPNYDIGDFLRAFYNRLYVRDDFSCPAIGMASFIPTSRKHRITYNPYIIWDVVYREECKKFMDESVINYYDDILTKSMQRGHWISEEAFKDWTDLHQKEKFIRADLHHFIKAVTTHEICHIIMNHLTIHRSESIIETNKEKRKTLAQIENIGMDFAINQSLNFGSEEIAKSFMTRYNKTLLFTFLMSDETLFQSRGADRELSFSEITEENINIKYFDHDRFMNQTSEYYIDLLKKGGQTPQGEQSLAKLGVAIGSLSGKEYSIEDLTGHGNECGVWAGKGVEQFNEFNDLTDEEKRVTDNDLRQADRNAKSQNRTSLDDFFDSHQIPDFVKKYVKAIISPSKISWETIYQFFIMRWTNFNDYEYTYKKESRKIEGQFPGRSMEIGYDAVYAMDRSGSVSKADYNAFAAETEKISQTVHDDMVRFIEFSDGVVGDHYVSVKSIPEVPISATGGTAFLPVLTMLAKEGNGKPVLCFTDGYIEDGYKQADFSFQILIFATSSCSDSQAESLRERGFIVIHQGGNNDWFSKMH